MQHVRFENTIFTPVQKVRKGFATAILLPRNTLRTLSSASNRHIVPSLTYAGSSSKILDTFRLLITAIHYPASESHCSLTYSALWQRRCCVECSYQFSQSFHFRHSHSSWSYHSPSTFSTQQRHLRSHHSSATPSVTLTRVGLTAAASRGTYPVFPNIQLNFSSSTTSTTSTTFDLLGLPFLLPTLLLLSCIYTTPSPSYTCLPHTATTHTILQHLLWQQRVHDLHFEDLLLRSTLGDLLHPLLVLHQSKILTTDLYLRSNSVRNLRLYHFTGSLS